MSVFERVHSAIARRKDSQMSAENETKSGIGMKMLVVLVIAAAAAAEAAAQKATAEMVSPSTASRIMAMT